MPRLFWNKHRIRRKQVRKLVWIVISFFATLALVLSTVLPGFAS